jgi:hypothetical protein
MGWNIPAKCKLIRFGHSFVVQWQDGPLLKAAIDYFTTSAPVGAGTSAIAIGANRPTFINKGVSGETLTTAAAGRIQADVVANNTGSNPVRVLIQHGINDKATSLGTVATLAASILNQMIAPGSGTPIPAGNIAWVAPIIGSEPSDDVAVDGLCTTIQAACVAAGAVFLDVRTLYKAYRAGGGARIENDATHPAIGTAAAPFHGQLVYGGFLQQVVTLG